MAIKIVIGDFALEAASQFIACFLEVERRHGSAGPTFERFALAKDNALKLFGPAAERFAKAAREHVDNRFGKRSAARLKVQDIGRFNPARDEKHGHIANDLAAGRDLHNVAK